MSRLLKGPASPRVAPLRFATLCLAFLAAWFGSLASASAQSINSLEGLQVLGPDYLLYVSSKGAGDGIWKLKDGIALFTYLHLAPVPDLTAALQSVAPTTRVPTARVFSLSLRCFREQAFLRWHACENTF